MAVEIVKLVERAVDVESPKERLTVQSVWSSGVQIIVNVLGLVSGNLGNVVVVMPYLRRELDQDHQPQQPQHPLQLLEIHILACGSRRRI